MSQTPPRGWLRLSGPALITGGLGILAVLALGAGGLAEPDVATWTAAALTVLVLAVVWRSARVVDPEGQPPLAPTRPPHENAPPYVSIINALPDPVLVIAAHEPDDLTGRRFVMVNDAARDLLRIQFEAGLLVTAIRDPQVLEAVDEALFGGLDSQAVYEMGGAQARVLKAFAKPLGEAPDGSRLALLVLRDETDIRRAEQTRADFLANASHELRTPLASLSGFIETLRGHARTDEGAREKFLTIMSTQAERMARLIDDLLSLSRIELNEHIAPQGETDLASAVMDVIDALGPLARERGVTLVPCLPPRGVAVVSGDRDQIVQVAQNLVDNALKYSPREGSVKIALVSGLTADAAAAPLRAQSARLSLLTPDHGPDLYAALRVTDSGVGLKREHLPRLTERFYRVEGQKSGERSGTGLGLAIVKHIMNRHRGGLAVESVEGEGATFSAYFPLIPGSLALPAVPSPGAVTKPS
ncbi:MAG: ATP-binding protein [Phenylobacterium sp.]|uniref:sensor histidine kinase n=1 Tax=Phenylobacterium sp. TaxID=1871053 RepID=UPI002720CE5B|nr:ATP-binding protein [Phenylobacterium sp.]MDO9246179.1 ATP-binding protein [Phenylobacterium sp.]MDP3634469.1 ATP-binding protein [Phenylobacterium sp.]